jgi:hypothetical protein
MNPKKLFSKHRSYGLGFRASLIDGLEADVFELAGLQYSDELHDKVWRNQNWRELVERCGAEVIETRRSEGGGPGQSDVWYWVAVEDAEAFRAVLREHLLSLLAEPASKKATVSTTELHTHSGSSMLSGYWTSVLLTQRRNGSFTLKVHAGGEGTTRSEYCSRPFRTAKGFVLALNESSKYTDSWTYGEEDIDSWLPAIEKLDQGLAKKLRTLRDSD